MKKNIKIMAITTVLGLTMGTVAFADTTTNTNTTATTTTETTTEDTVVDLSPQARVFTESELSAEYKEYSTITLKDNASTTDSKNVTISGNTITINSAGTYVVSGKLTNGQIVINTKDKDKVQLVLNNATINNDTNASIYVEKASGYAMITLADGTVNSLSDKEEYVLTSEEEVDSVVYSKADLVLNGTGTLNVNANYNDAIKSNDTLHIVSGTYNVTSKQDAIYGKDAVVVDGGNFNVYTYTGAESAPVVVDTMGFDINNMPEGFVPPTFNADGTSGEFMKFEFDPNNMPEGFVPPQFDPNNMPEGFVPPQFNSNGADGTTSATVTNGQKPATTTAATTDTTTTVEEVEDTGSNKGIKSKGEIVINDGVFVFDTYDDGIKSGTFTEINGGDFTIKSGGDAVKGEYVLTINGGKFDIQYSYEGLEAKVINLNGGDLNILSLDDGINASDPEATEETFPITPMGSNAVIDYENDPMIYFNGANVSVYGKGDSIDANGGIVVSAGSVYVQGVNNGGEMAIDADKSLQVTGGDLFVLGGMTTISTSSSQNVVVQSLDTNIAVGDTVTVVDSKGNVLLSEVAEISTNNVTFSTDNINLNETYTIKYGTSEKTVTPTQAITNNGNSGMMGGKGGGTRPTGTRPGTSGTTSSTTNTTTNSNNIKSTGLSNNGL